MRKITRPQVARFVTQATLNEIVTKRQEIEEKNQELKDLKKEVGKLEDQVMKDLKEGLGVEDGNLIAQIETNNKRNTVSWITQFQILYGQLSLDRLVKEGKSVLDALIELVDKKKANSLVQKYMTVEAAYINAAGDARVNEIKENQPMEEVESLEIKTANKE